VLIFGQFPQSVPPKSDIQFLLQRGGATVSPSLNDFIVAGAGATTPSKAAKESKPKVDFFMCLNCGCLSLFF